MANRTRLPRNAGRLTNSPILLGTIMLAMIAIVGSWSHITNMIFDAIDSGITVSTCRDLKSDSYNGTIPRYRVSINDRVWQCPDEEPQAEISVELRDLVYPATATIIGIDEGRKGYFNFIRWGSSEGRALYGEYRLNAAGNWRWSSNDKHVRLIPSDERATAEWALNRALLEVKTPEHLVASIAQE